MKYSHTPSSCEGVRSQSQPASVSTVSQHYPRSDDTPSHNPNFPANNQHHVYADLGAAAWQGPDVSYAEPSPIPFLYFTQSGGSSDATSLHQPSASTWPTSCIGQEFQHWNPYVNGQNFVPRSAASDGNIDESASMSQQSHDVWCQYSHRQVLNARHELPHSPPDKAYRGAERFNELRVSSVSTQDVQKLHPVSQLPCPRSRMSPLRTNSVQVPLKSHGYWDGGSEIAKTGQQHYSNQPSTTCSSHLIPTKENSISIPIWSIVNPGEPSSAPSRYRQIYDVDHCWPIMQGSRPHYDAQIDLLSHSTVQLMSNRRQNTKKQAAKVPSSFVERQEKLKVSKRKGPLQEKQRKKAHTMRKSKKICVRCRFYKTGCDEGNSCQKCEKIEGHARSFNQPCYRLHLEDMSLVRRCNGREHQEEAKFRLFDWVTGSDLDEIEIFWNLPSYGAIPNAQPMRFTYRSYSPKRGPLDRATSIWSNTKGEVLAIEQPAYAIYDTASLVLAFETYFSSLQPTIEDWIYRHTRQDDIAFLTYQEVTRVRRATGSKVLDLALRLQCISVVSQGYGSVLSNVSGILEYDYGQLGRSEYEAYNRNSYDRPLPGAIAHQLDVAAVAYLRKLEKRVLKELAALIFKSKIKPWYELFLAFFVILSNLEYIHHGAKSYIKSKSGTVIETQVKHVVNIQIKKWESTFPILLYHWRCTLRGYSPFKLARNNPDELRKKGHMDMGGFQYVTAIAAIFDRADPNRFQAPFTGSTITPHSMSSEWIVNLFDEAGA